jgi:mannose-6-phosphate isomerase-like protein (cupin superfamily)
MATTSDLAKTFLHLDDDGGAEPVEPTPSFWTGRTSAGYARVMGAFDFAMAGDLHPSMQEMHPEADEVIYLASGAIDVVLEEAGGERAVALEEGEFAVVPRGVWHRLVVRQPGRLVFVNSRAGMQSRPWSGEASSAEPR